MSEKKAGGTGLHRNLTSYIGFLVAAAGVFLILFAMAVELSLQAPSPYVGMFTYMIFPGVVAGGFALALFGMWRESKRRRRLGTTEALPYPRVDLNDATHRRKFAYVSVGGFLMLIVLGFAGYNAFLFTESVTFCGKLCHTVMEPEYAAYQHSPHAKVRCVDCHVGHGASFYVKSKLSGARQVLAVTFNTYERPIPTPVENLRPARETCEQCHWPQKFFGAQLMQNPHFRYDEANTAEQISLVVKTGGGSARLGQNAGIHWHMVVDNEVIYAASDRRHQTIPWVQVRDHAGRVTEYVDRGSALAPEQLAELPRTTMDCMSCHNRPSHIHPAPDTAVDAAMAGGVIDRTLPWIKKVAVDSLVVEYPDRAAAHVGIREAVQKFYAARYPEVVRTRSSALEEAAGAICGIYDKSVFPEMKVNWQTYPLHIGHRNWPGCFRCHDGRHVSPEGKVLSMECTVCHTMPQRGPLAPLGSAVPVTEMPWHPLELKGRHAEILCSQCHSAGTRAPSDCGECHKMNAAAPMMSDCSACHQVPGARQPQNDCKSCHDKPKGLHLKGGHPGMTCTDCHAPHVWKVAAREGCLSCHEDRKEHNAPEACGSCHDFRA